LTGVNGLPQSKQAHSRVKFSVIWEHSFLGAFLRLLLFWDYPMRCLRRAFTAAPIRWVIPYFDAARLFLDAIVGRFIFRGATSQLKQKTSRSVKVLPEN
jgi:hypothetical protein